MSPSQPTGSRLGLTEMPTDRPSRSPYDRRPPSMVRRERSTSRSPADVRQVETSIPFNVATSSWTGSARASSSLRPPTRRNAPNSSSAAARRRRFSSPSSARTSMSRSGVRIRAGAPLLLQRAGTARRAVRAPPPPGPRPEAGGRRPVQSVRSAASRSRRISSRNSRTASALSSRRPSLVIDTSSSVAGPPPATNAVASPGP